MALQYINPLSANPTKWSNTSKVCRLLPTNCLSFFDHSVGLMLKRLTQGKLTFSFPTIFVHTEKLKILNLSAKILVPKSGNCCHFWPVGIAISILN